MPTAENIIAKMSNARFFSKVDASSGYWQIKVDEVSSDLLTFLTPFGKYKFLRLPFGIHSASEIFQAEIANIISDVENAANSQDDIIIWGNTLEEHNETLIKVLSRIKNSGLKLNKSKCIFGVNEVLFIGHIISDEGVKTDPKKIEAIVNIPIPTNKTELQRYLGMVNYLGKFLPNLSQLTLPLRQLLQKDIEFIIEVNHIEAIRNLNKLITSAPTLKFFNHTLNTRLRSDASSEGLGALLEQQHQNDWYPVAYASRSLTDAENNYAQIEKETLSILFGCERFHEYLYGRHFIVYNDHQPLKSIFNKPLASCPPRIQRLFLRLQRYEFDFMYAQGKTMVVSDTLSRAHLAIAQSEINESDMLFFVHSVINQFPVSDRKLKQLQDETAKDKEMNLLKEYTMNGWPELNNINVSMQPYFNIRGEIAYNHGLMLKGIQIIIPYSMRSEMKQIIHQGHLGIEKCKKRCRQSVYWPNINKEISDLVSNCSTCLNNRNQQQREPLLPQEIPSEPWIKISVDLFTLYKKKYVLVIDYYSKYFEIAHLENESTSALIIKLKKMFARHGIPKIVFSDNGPQFTSRDFKTFSTNWDFEQQMSSPEYPRSNGLVERKIQTVKRTLKKANESNDDPYLSLLILNTAPDENGISPASLLYKRHLRTNLPTIKESFNENSKQFQRKYTSDIRESEQLHYDARSRKLQPLEEETTVRINSKNDSPRWKRKGKIIAKRTEPRSYDVLNENGNIIRRNRIDLIPTKEKFEPEEERYDDLLENETEIEPITNEGTLIDQPYVTRSGRTVRKPDRYTS